MKKTLSLVLALFLCLSLCACGSSQYKTQSAPAAAPAYVTADSAAVANAGFGVYESAAEAEEMPMPSVELAGSAEVPESNPEKIIYSADVNVETTDFDASLEKLNRLIAEYEGYVESSSLNSSNYGSIAAGHENLRSAGYTVRVPAKHFDTLMNRLSDLGNVPYRYVYTENVSAQYYDTQARLNACKAQEERLLELLDLANTVSEVIEIEGELSNVRYKIESLETSLRGWDRRVDYSTVYLNLSEVREYTPEQRPGFLRQLGQAFRNGFSALKDFVLWLAEALPVLIVLGAVVFGLVVLIRRLIRKGKLRKAPEKKKKDEPET